MSYVLESKTEFERLEIQSRLHCFSHEVDLQGFAPPARSLVLDAGTGSGIVARHLAGKHPEARILGCDVSAERVGLARAASPGLGNLTFEVQDLKALSYPADHLDAAFCRYVLMHLGPEGRLQALRELHRALKPGGLLRVVEMDNVLQNVHPTPAPIPELLAALPGAEAVMDFRFGRKVPALLVEAGFEEVETRIESMSFTEEEHETGYQVFDWTLQALEPLFSKLLGSEERGAAARQAYASLKDVPGAVMYMSKFIVTARKPSR